MAQPDEKELIRSITEARLRVFDTRIAATKAWIEVDEMNKKLIAAGLAKDAVLCW